MCRRKVQGPASQSFTLVSALGSQRSIWLWWAQESLPLTGRGLCSSCCHELPMSGAVRDTLGQDVSAWQAIEPCIPRPQSLLLVPGRNKEVAEPQKPGVGCWEDFTWARGREESHKNALRNGAGGHHGAQFWRVAAAWLVAFPLPLSLLCRAPRDSLSWS